MTNSIAPILKTASTELPAGGGDPTCFDWKEVWYPVYYLKDLTQSKPIPFTLLGQNIVIWWDKTAQTWRAFADQCPHRLAPLSEGTINEEGRIECPYHGWAFSGGGKCESIPQQAEGIKAETSQRACVKAYATTVRQGLLFVYPGNLNNAEKTKVPLIEAIEETPSKWLCIDTFRDLPYDALTLMENVLDASHVPYTHHRTVGNRANVSPVKLEILESGKSGFQGTWAEGPRRGTLGRQDTTFIAPGFMFHDLTSQQFGRTLTVVYATPIRPGECRLFARFPFKFSSKFLGLFIKLTPRWYSHIGQNAILEDDQIFLHYQERYLEKNGGSSNFSQAFYLPTKADLFVSELRQWVNKYSITPFPDAKLSPPLSKSVLLERYHSHTRECASCRQALENIQKSRSAVAILGVIFWAFAPLLCLNFGEKATLPVVFLTLTVLSCGVVWLGLRKLEKRFYQGREIPPRNLPEKK